MKEKPAEGTGQAVAKKVKVPAEKKGKKERKADAESADAEPKKEKTKKIRHLCKWKKSRYEEKFGDLTAIVSPVRFICLKCGRAASDVKYLCKPNEIAG